MATAKEYWELHKIWYLLLVVSIICLKALSLVLNYSQSIVSPKFGTQKGVFAEV